MFLSWLTVGNGTIVGTACESALSSHNVRFAHIPKIYNSHRGAASACIPLPDGLLQMPKIRCFRHKSGQSISRRVRHVDRPKASTAVGFTRGCVNVFARRGAILPDIHVGRNGEIAIVKKIFLAILVLASALAWAGTDPNPADYTVNVHVTSSSIVEDSDKVYGQKLNVVIEGKKYELEFRPANALLVLGDYKAKLIKDEHKTAYDSSQVYEFLFPDKKTRKFRVVGQSE
jgi:hypothetical protein